MWILHKYGPVRVSGKAGAAAEPKVQGRAYEGAPLGFPHPKRVSVVQKLLLKIIKIIGVLLKLIEVIPGSAQTNR